MEDNKEINFEDTMKKLENIANELANVFTQQIKEI